MMDAFTIFVSVNPTPPEELGTLKEGGNRSESNTLLPSSSLSSLSSVEINASFADISLPAAVTSTTAISIECILFATKDGVTALNIASFIPSRESKEECGYVSGVACVETNINIFALLSSYSVIVTLTSFFSLAVVSSEVPTLSPLCFVVFLSSDAAISSPSLFEFPSSLSLATSWSNFCFCCCCSFFDLRKPAFKAAFETILERPFNFFGFLPAPLLLLIPPPLLLILFLLYSTPLKLNLEYSPASAYLASTVTARTPNRTTFLSSSPAYSFLIHSTHRFIANREHLSCFFHSTVSSPVPLHAIRNCFIFLIARSTSLSLSPSSVNAVNANDSHATSYARPCIPPSLGKTFSPATDANNVFTEELETPTAVEDCSTRSATFAIFLPRLFRAIGIVLATNSLLKIEEEEEDEDEDRRRRPEMDSTAPSPIVVAFDDSCNNPGGCTTSLFISRLFYSSSRLLFLTLLCCSCAQSCRRSN
mmetsp:Transcript_6957/g.23078  ORF Transcript_6957/g.23078 Transcript_6957/m.23078 type:complete len:478 (+) Transcript_6957:6005-7438(+)